MTVAELPPQGFAAALRAAGLIVRLGPFAVRLHITEPTLVAPLYDLFAHYELCPPEKTVVSFEVSILRERRAMDGFRAGFTCRLDGQLQGRSLSLPLALPILEWTINWGIGNHANHFLMIHAAVVERNGVALVMPGMPGSGKSTLCAYLVAHGWRLFSDEFALIAPETGQLVPMPRPISLKNRSIEIIQAVAPQLHFGPLIEGTLKGTVALVRPPVESILRQNETAPPRWIIFPKWREGAAAALEPLEPVALFKALISDAINYEMLGEQGFRSLRDLIERCGAYRLAFDRLDDALRLIEGLEPSALPEDRTSHATAG